MPKPLAVVPELEAELDRLFGLLPAEFTRARDDLSRRLKQAGQSAASARVKGLRKPTVPVWAVNQIAQRHPTDVEAFLGAGDELRSAQEEALGGGDTAKLRSATGAERQALRKLTQRASDVLNAEGHAPTPAVLDRVASTLRAAAADPGARELLATGRLTEELESTGFGALEGMKVTPRSRRARSSARSTKPAVDRRHEEQVRKLRERAQKLEAEAAEAEDEANRAEAAAEQARRKAERARAAAKRASAAVASAERR